MLFWIFAGIIAYIATVWLPSLFLVSQIGVMGYAKGRDEEPTSSPLHGRAQRAARNVRENFPVFLTLAVLSLVIDTADLAQAIWGAQIFVVSRVFFPAAYMSGIPFLRSTVYTIGFIGCLVMALALSG